MYIFVFSIYSYLFPIYSYIYIYIFLYIPTWCSPVSHYMVHIQFNAELPSYKATGSCHIGRIGSCRVGIYMVECRWDCPGHVEGL